MTMWKKIKQWYWRRKHKDCDYGNMCDICKEDYSKWKKAGRPSEF